MNPQPVSLADELRKLVEKWRERTKVLREGGSYATAHRQVDLCASELEQALLAQHAVAEPRITPQMMSQVFAKSVNNTDPEHQHIYDHRIAAEALNALLTPAHAAEQPKLTEEQVRMAVETFKQDYFGMAQALNALPKRLLASQETKS